MTLEYKHVIKLLLYYKFTFIHIHSHFHQTTYTSAAELLDS